MDKIVSKKLARFRNVKYALSTKIYGNLSLRHQGVKKSLTLENRRKFFKSIGMPLEKVANAGLCHGNKIYEAKKPAGYDKLIPGYDGLFTRVNNIYLTVTAADCYPVFFYDPENKFAGLAHAGWRGVKNGIVVKMIKKFINEGSIAAKIIVYVGPGIGACHFKVGKDIFDIFNKKFSNKIAFKAKGKYFVDLPAALKNQLKTVGVSEKNLEISGLCTFCDKSLFFSYRRDKKKYRAHAAVIGMK